MLFILGKWTVNIKQHILNMFMIYTVKIFLELFYYI